MLPSDGSVEMPSWSLQVKTLIILAAVLALVTAKYWVPPRVEGPASGRDIGAGERLVVVMRTAPNLEDADHTEALVNRFKDAGVTEVWVQFKQDETDEVRGGEVFYPSQVAPVAQPFQDDRLGRLIDALTAADIRVCAWTPALNDAAAWQAHPHWRAKMIDDQGEAVEQDGWLCPQSEKAIEYESRILREIASRYPRIFAIYTDFIRFDSDLSCVCDRCLSKLNDQDGVHGTVGVQDVREAAKEGGKLWEAWISMRAQAICDAVDFMRDSIEQARPDLWFGACVLPFSASDYSFNTQSGQDYYEMARVGLDELVVMGYWDDWDKSPQWLKESLESASELVKDECQLSCLIDGDMSVRRTWLTLDSIRSAPVSTLGYFNYGQWRVQDLQRIVRSQRGAQSGPPPRPAYTAVVIRIDTEPDDSRRYDTLSPEMITRLVEMFDDEGIKTTFVTCGRIAELQPQAVRFAAERGHELACHAYDHEQLDDLSPEAERRAITFGLDALKAAGLDVRGFGAPRNSITDNGRDLLIERRLEYDGSAAYDPMVSQLDVDYAHHTSGDGRRIIVVPFIMPNDWDALRSMKVSPTQMEQMWRERLARVAAQGEPVFVLDVHQWLASAREEMEVLRQFIALAKSRSDCRLMTLREAADHARNTIEQVEHAAATAGQPRQGDL
jgi:peptidoglycan/xylan/chitin deacetylase (PgdA/CDA1 family)